jgi:hypothetical protein
MLRIFNSRIQNTQSDLLEETQLEFGRNMLKTAIIESNIEPDKIRSHDSFEEHHDISENLLMAKTENSSGEGWLFFDFYDSRFWIVFSLGKSQFFKKAIDSLLNSKGSGLDRLWLPAGRIEWIGEMGTYEKVKVNFEAGEVFPGEFTEENLAFTDLSIDGSGTSSKRLYDILKSTDEIDNFLALSQIQIRKEVDGNFVRDRISNDGSFTTRGGDNIQVHISIIEKIKDMYAELLSRIEENHIIGAKNNGIAGRAKGSPVVIKFSKPIPDVEKFLSHVVDARDPFRLLGHTKAAGASGPAQEQVGRESVQEPESNAFEVNKGSSEQFGTAFKINGIDAHNGDRFRMEVSKEWIRLYLYNDACGNTALRLFTNIQQYYDPAAELIVADV